MTRHEMTEWLINDDIECIHTQMWDGDIEYLRYILMGDGFIQYRYMSTEDLEDEVKARKELEDD